MRKEKSANRTVAMLLCMVMIGSLLFPSQASIYAETNVPVKSLVKNTTDGKVVIPLDKKKTLKLSLTVKAGNLTFRSNKKSVATVSSKGLIKAKKTGTAKITVKGRAGTVKGLKQVIVVYVVHKSVKSVAMNVTQKQLQPGKSFTLKTKVTPSKAANVVTYQSNKTSVATVSSNGKVLAKNPGTAKITATTVDGKKKAVCVVSVVQATETDNKAVDTATPVIETTPTVGPAATTMSTSIILPTATPQLTSTVLPTPTLQPTSAVLITLTPQETQKVSASPAILATPEASVTSVVSPAPTASEQPEPEKAEGAIMPSIIPIPETNISFNTVEDMKAADLEEGDIVKTNVSDSKQGV